MHGAGLRPAALQPVVLGQLGGGEGVFDGAGPEFWDVVGGEGGEEGEGVNEVVALFGEGEGVWGWGAGVGVREGEEEEEDVEREGRGWEHG